MIIRRIERGNETPPEIDLSRCSIEEETRFSIGLRRGRGDKKDDDVSLKSNGTDNSNGAGCGVKRTVPTLGCSASTLNFLDIQLRQSMSA